MVLDINITVKSQASVFIFGLLYLLLYIINYEVFFGTITIETITVKTLLMKNNNYEVLYKK